MTMSKSSLPEHALALSDDLREAYDALAEFHDILEESAYSLQRCMLTDWLDTYTASSHEGTRRCANTIRHYRSYIQNSWKYGQSNGPCEGLNNKIKILKRNCYGVHDFEHFRRRVLFCCGSTQFVRETYYADLELASSGKDDR